LRGKKTGGQLPVGRLRSPARCEITKRGDDFNQWAWVELNYRPHAYQACALTT
jgi:hypothetical protein